MSQGVGDFFSSQGVGDFFSASPPGMDGVAITEDGAYDVNATSVEDFFGRYNENPEEFGGDSESEESLSQSEQVNYDEMISHSRNKAYESEQNKGKDITKLVSSTAGGLATSAPVANASQNIFNQGIKNPLVKQAFNQGKNVVGKGLDFGARRIGGMMAGGSVGFGPGAALGLIAPDAVPALMKQGVGALDRYNNEKNGNPLHTLQRRNPDDHPGNLLTRAMQGEHRQAPDLTKHSFR